MIKKALIIGISGQDGAFLARLLLEKGYRVAGTSRRDTVASFENLERLGIRNRVTIESVSTDDSGRIRQVIADHEPEEIYNLSGQSSVARSFDHPVETHESIVSATRYLLTAVRDLSLPAKVFYAGSGDCFGNAGTKPVRETTPFDPRSPYAQAKVAAFRLIETFRRTHGLFACTGILFNHESCLRPEQFVTQKIVSTALAIAQGRSRELVLGNTSICRDWGWAPEYVEAMWQMLQQKEPEDYIVATGTTISLADFVDTVFTRLGLDRHRYVRTDARFFRPADIQTMQADPSKIYRNLGWRARTAGREVAIRMLAAEKTRTGLSDQSENRICSNP